MTHALQQIADPAFPQMAAVFDVERMTALLDETLSRAGNGYNLENGKITDVKYIPGSRCNLLFQFKVRRKEGGRSRPQMVAVQLLKEGEPPPAPPSPSDVTDFAEHAGSVLPGPFFPVEEPGMVISTFPYDPAMPWLPTAVEPRSLKKRLCRQWPEKNQCVNKVRVELLGYTPHMRAAFLYKVQARDTKTGEASVVDLIAKTNAFKKTGQLFADALALWETADGSFPMPRPVCFLSVPRVTLQERVEGQRLGSCVTDPDFCAVVSQTAEALARLHGFSFPLNARRRARDEVKSLTRWGEVVSCIRADQGRRITRLLDALCENVAARTLMSAPIHADFHHTNVLVDQGRIHVIDFDEMAYGDPSVDVGRFLASLRIPSLRAYGDLHQLADAREAFLSTYLCNREGDPARIRLFEAACLLTSAASAFRIQRPNWNEEVTLLVDEAERVFAEARQVTLPAPSPEDPPTLPWTERTKWAGHARYLQGMLDRLVRDTYGAELEQCHIDRRQEKRSACKIQVTLKGRAGGKKWKQKVLVLLRKENGGQAAFKKREETYAEAPAGNPPCRRPLVYLSRIGAAVFERARRAVQPPDSDLSHARLALVESLQKSIKGKTAVVSGEPGLWRGPFAAVLKNTEPFSREDFLEGSSTFKTVVLLEALGDTASPEHPVGLERAWSRVEEGGRMVVVVPNADACEREDALSRRHLRRLLKTFGKVRLLKEQPFRWCAMEVRKIDESDHDLARDKKERYRITARLCHGRVLELGCGRGHLTQLVAERGLEAKGVDISLLKIEEARERYPGGDYVCADILDLDIEPGEWDTVLLPEILEHVDEEVGREMVERAWSLLRPGGRLVVSVPNQDCIPHPHHVRWFDAESLTAELEAFGEAQFVADQPYKWLLAYVDKPREATH